MIRPSIVERYTDNGELSHYELINNENGAILWGEEIEDYNRNLKGIARTLIDGEIIKFEQIIEEGKKSTPQFNEWHDIFDLQSVCKKLGLSELEKWCVLGNRFEIIDKKSIKNTIRAEKLALELYEDLKDKYILLKQELDLLSIKLAKANSKIGKLSHNLSPLMFGRKQFNFAVKLCRKLVLNSAIENNFELDPICKLIEEINLLIKPPITEYNKNIMNDSENESKVNNTTVDLEKYF